MEQLQQTIKDAVAVIARVRNPDLGEVELDQELLEQLGFDSLDLAQLVAVLEVRLGVDPFATHTTIAAMRTVRDLCRAYGEVCRT